MSSIGINIGTALKGGQGFSPQSISDLIAWYDAAKGITLNGADVSDWADQSGNGNDVSQGTASAQPLFVASNSNFNNQPSLRFDGGDEFLKRTTFTGGDIPQPNTILLAYNWADNIGTQVLYDGILTTERQSIVLSGTQAIIHGGSDQNIHTENTATHILAAIFNAASSDSFRDGTQSTPAGSVGAEPIGGLTIGALFNDSLFAAVDIAEMSIYNKELPDTELNLWGNYAAAKYGTIWTDI